jgi:creatinine amidohydrolase
MALGQVTHLSPGIMNLTDLTWPAVQRLAPDTPIVFPVAALEQHGHHMPLFTDSLLLGEVVRRVMEKSPFREQVLFAPLQWLGNSHHHLDMPGTLSAEPRVYLDLLRSMLDNFVHHGFRRIIIINGHGGNDVPGKQVIFEARQQYRSRRDLLFLFATYWNLAPDLGTAAGLFHQNQMGHACEWETSMMLRLRPDLVHEHESVAEVPFGNPFEPAARAWTMLDRSEPGHIGAPARATAEKGEMLFAHFARGFEQLLTRVLAWDGRSWNG